AAELRGGVFLGQTDRRLVPRVFAAHVAIEDPQPIHVRADVAGRDEDRADAADLPLVVEERADDRDPRGAGDVVEARLPVRPAASRSGRRRDQEEPVRVTQTGRRLLDDVRAPAAVDRLAAEPPEHAPERPPEELALAEPTGANAERPRHGEHV